MQRIFRKGLKFLPLPFFMLFFWGMALAQNGENPFELVPRAGTKAAQSTPQSVPTPIDNEDTTVAEVSPPIEQEDNPFALAPAFEGEVKPRKKARSTTTSTDLKEEVETTIQNPVTPAGDTSLRAKRFVFSAVILDLILVAILLTLLRNYFQKSISSFFNDNLLSQVFREREAGTLIPFLIFYFLFFYNLALFIFLLTGFYGIPLKQGALISFLYILSGVILAFFGKHLLLRIVGYIFPVDKELRKYSFTIMIFGIVTGFFLLLANLLIAYSPAVMTKYVVFSSFGIIILIYLFRSLRGVFIANKYFWFHKFHFLLYICTVEIAPAVIVLKLILNET